MSLIFCVVILEVRLAGVCSVVKNLHKLYNLNFVRVVLSFSLSFSLTEFLLECKSQQTLHLTLLILSRYSEQEKALT